VVQQDDRMVGIIGDRVGQLGKMKNTGWEGRGVV
jgi:hypothetical protein